MSFTAPKGVVAPLLTPFNDDLSIANDLYLAHAKSMLEQGCGGLAPFGTTGEALSVGIDERIEAMQGLIGGGIDPALLIPGTGLSNIADTARLSRASEIRYSLRYKKIRYAAGKAFVDVLIDASFTITDADGNPVRRDMRDRNQFVLEQDGDDWKFLSGM